jgi:hypothetical protein
VLFLSLVIFVSALPIALEARSNRNHKSVANFKRIQPCPVSGMSKGPCPGYVVDHVYPLACGGADLPTNMQWQTVAEAKAKDKWERKVCAK